MAATLSGKVILLSGGSRGIGLAIARRAARDGASIAFIAKTAEPHPTLPGTVYTAAAAIERDGGHALPIVGDIRDDERVLAAVARTVEQFGALDICINNASAIDLSDSQSLTMRRYDLMQDINARGTYALSRACLPHLLNAANPHILTLSPPINLDARWAGNHLGYTIAKYGMSLCTLGLAYEFQEAGIAVNSLWPGATVATEAIATILGPEVLSRSRSVDVMADAAHLMLTESSRKYTGEFLLDEEVLARYGQTDLSKYRSCEREDQLERDLFLDSAS